MASNRLASPGAIDEFIRAHFRYRDESEEILREPEFMLNDLSRIGYLEGDCDDVSILYATLLKAIGLAPQFVAIRFNPANPDFEHVFVRVYDMAAWRVYDGTVEPGTQIKAVEVLTMEV